MIRLSSSFTNFGLFSSLRWNNIDLASELTSEFRLAILFILCVSLNVESVLVFPGEVESLLAQSILIIVLLEILLPIVFSQSEWSVSEVNILEELSQVNDVVTNNLIRCEEVHIPRLNSHAVILAWHLNFVQKSPVPGGLAVLATEMGIGLLSILLGIEESSYVGITGTLNIHHLQVN